MTMTYLPDLRGRALALHVLNSIRAQHIRWDQDRWRGFVLDEPLGDRCGTALCFAGACVEVTGATWLLDRAADGKYYVQGREVNWREVDLSIGDGDQAYLIASDEDEATTVRHGLEVTHVMHRAASLLGLSAFELDPLFAARNTFGRLEQLVDELLPEEVAA